MEVKAVFFDIDGTLVNDHKSVLKSTKDAIKIVKEQGVLVGVATGRGPFFVKELMDDLDLDFAVTYNGQYIFTKDRVLFTSPISKLHLRQLISYAKKEGKEIALGTKDAMLGSKIMSFGLGSFSQRISRFVPSVLTRTVSHFFNRMVSKVVPQKEEDLLDLMNQPIYQVLMLMTPEESEKAAADFEDLKLTRSNPFAADVINQGNSKLKVFAELEKNMALTSTKSWPLVIQITTLKCLQVLVCRSLWEMVVAVSRKLLSTLPLVISKTESTRPWNILVF